jgi:plasmid stabilization system protein ParE
MNYAVERADNADRDLNAIVDFLIETYVAFGEDEEDAIDSAEKRIHRIEAAMRALGRAPHQGTLRPELAPGLRSVTRDRAIFYFDVDDDRRVVRVLAVFFGGQDHQRLMLKRLLARR